MWHPSFLPPISSPLPHAADPCLLLHHYHPHPSTWSPLRRRNIASSRPLAEMPGLAASRWAPRRHCSRSGTLPDSPLLPASQPPSSTTPQTPRTTQATQPDRPSPDRELSRFLKIIARLNWKLPSLKQGYMVAKNSAGKPRDQAEMHEIQFKLDFHEFYMLVERALVRLLAVFGVAVDGGAPRPDAGAFPGQQQQHRYHANVLAALDNAENPLHRVFGQPEVRRQLLRAKELRNRWKHADDEDEPRRPPPAPLQAYNLELIVATVLQAIDQAHVLAVQYIRENSGGLAAGQSNPAADEEDWEFMVDAMDWEAV
ncbi:hypothetical protein GGS23DRAFT_558884 [Durotheca rogersii]|uniref:uncharacterized protein n=1 Tax=Durotheca rogersii TaxID=419775 RepID=UPI00221F3973|nr:uncharacterized protein GGS23DRAFT_558884 [Durotheca rogersii]KAI5865364.1 hypothetical protein GGS23DRAFT_558884 [Durotheca rogersii]